ncbi:MAG: serine hydrolase, partial [Sphingobacteriales bacterium]
MKKRIAANIWFLLLIVSPVFAQQKANEASFSESQSVKLDKLLNDYISKGWIKAVSASILVDGKPVYNKAFGNNLNRPARTDDILRIASQTKAVTCTAAMILFDEGKFGLDDPISKYIPAFKNPRVLDKFNPTDSSYTTKPATHEITVRELMTHTLETEINKLAKLPLAGQPGERWQYSLSIDVLGRLVEVASGLDLNTFFKERIFKPLAMNTSNTNIPDMEKSKDASLGYDTDDNGKIKKLDYFHINGMAPAGAINSSANEMGNYLIAWMNGGKFKGKEVIPTAFQQQAISSQMVMSAALPAKERPDLYFSTYGFGWMLSSYKGHYRVEHGGNIDGFSASACFFPTDSIGIVVLTNQDGSSVPSVIRNILADKLLNLKRTDWNGELKTSADKSIEDQKKMLLETKVVLGKPQPTTHALSDFAGVYSHPGYGTLRIYVNKDSLFATGVKKGLWLKHNTYDIFDVYLRNLNAPVDT